MNGSEKLWSGSEWGSIALPLRNVIITHSPETQTLLQTPCLNSLTYPGRLTHGNVLRSAPQTTQYYISIANPNKTDVRL